MLVAELVHRAHQVAVTVKSPDSQAARDAADALNEYMTVFDDTVVAVLAAAARFPSPLAAVSSMGTGSTYPAVVALAAVQARPGDRLPDSETLMRVLAGTQPPATAFLRYAHDLLDPCATLHRIGDADQIPDRIHALLAVLIDQINRETGAILDGITFEDDAPTALTSLGEWVFWLVCKHTKALHHHDEPARAAEVGKVLEHYSAEYTMLVDAVHTGRIRGPVAQTDVVPPRILTPSPVGE
jgi:hypothetical protein